MRSLRRTAHDPFVDALDREAHARALKLVRPDGTVPTPRVQNLRERKVLVFRCLHRVVKDCRDAGVTYEAARRYAESGVWLVDQLYGRVPKVPA